MLCNSLSETLTPAPFDSLVSTVLAVSKRLGHAQPSITLNVYGHVIPSVQEEVASIMDEIITPILMPEAVPVAPRCTEHVESIKKYSSDMGKT